MVNTLKKYLTCLILGAMVEFGAAGPASAQRFGGGRMGSMFGGGGWGGGGLFGRSFSSGGGYPYGGYPGGMYNGGQFGQYPAQPIGSGYQFAPNSGYSYQNVAPAQQPAATQTRVYDPNTNRIFIRETNQYTGELWDPVNQRAYWPAAETTTPEAAPTAQPGAKTAEPKTVGPPRNFVEAQLKAAPDSTRKQVRNLIGNAYKSFIGDELEETLRPFLFSDVDRERLLGLAESKSNLTVDQMENLRFLVEQIDESAIRRKLEDFQVGRDQYSRILERIGLRKALNDLDDFGFRSPSTKTKPLISRLTATATKAGAPREQIRSLTNRLEDYWQLSEDLDNADLVGEGVDLASVTPETVFKVVRLRGFASKFPVMLAPGLILLPMSAKAPGRDKLIFQSATAVELLPICGSASQPLRDASADAPAAPLGVTLRVDPQSGADASICVTDETEQQSVPHTIKPGASLPFPNRKSIQMSVPDGRGGWGTWQKVSTGSYLLSLQGGTWQRTVEPSLVVLDNTANCYPFNFRIDGVDGTVPARQALSINLPTTAATIQFNRGIGDAVAVKALSGKEGRFAVRLATVGGLELYEAEIAQNNDVPALADAQPTPNFSGWAPSGAIPRSATPADGALEQIRLRFPVGTLDE